MIAFTGDLFIGDKEFEIDEPILDLLNKANVVVTNFENVLKPGLCDTRIDKSAILQITESCFDGYVQKIDTKILFTLGNNHLHDFGQEGVNYTIDFLNKYEKLKHTGIGYYGDVIKPIIIVENQKKIAILCVSTDEPEVMSIVATEKSKGVLDYNDPAILDIITQYKKIVDYFVIIPHWGREYVDYPSVQQRKKAYNWIDAGADLVIGHHPHVIQGKENYKGKWIYYSLGNYLFPDFFYKNGILHKWNNDNNKSILLDVTFDNSIEIKEIGLMLNISDRKLFLNDISLNDFLEKSKYLNVQKYSFKDYYGIWQKENYRILKKEFSFINRLMKLFPIHKNYSRTGYLLYRLKRKLIKSSSQ